MNVPPLVTKLAERCRDAGGRALLVGGCVRDHLMGAPVKDWDVEVYALPPDDLERVLRTLGRVDTVGRAFSVYKLHRKELELDVSIPRRDSNAGPGHKGIEAQGDPTMTPEQAARRRDLTVNAILYDPLTRALLDPAGGLAHLEAQVLAPVDTHTFLEDPLRALRAVQFAARFGFTPTDELVTLCTVATVDELPPERVEGEWRKLMLKGRHLVHGLGLARQAGLLTRVFPEAAPHTPTTTDALLDAATASRDALPDAPRAYALMLAVWLHACPPEAVQATLDRLRIHKWLGTSVRDLVTTVVTHHADPVHDDAALRWLSTRTEVELALRVREVVLPDPYAPARGDRAAELGVLHDKQARLIQGRDLIGLGVRPGPQMGVLVERLYAMQLDGDFHTREDALVAAAAAVAALE